jgi:hypothetical protein
MRQQPDADLAEPELPPLRTVRRILVLAFALGVVGTATELLLLGHFEEWRQVLPLVLLGLALLVLIWHALDRRPLPVRALQLLMLVFCLAGVLGLVFHYRGNVEFELEMYPSRAGVELFRKAITGATPALAPGAMILLALIGFAYAYDHPNQIRRHDAGRRRTS